MIVHGRQLLDHTSRAVTAPNNDTIYSSSFLELSGGAVELNIPSSTERYFSVAFMHAFTDVFAYVGTRATRGRGGRYLVVGPQWDGAVVGEATIIRSPTNDVWMLMRTLVAGPHDLPAARAFQEQLTLLLPEGRGPPRPFVNFARDVTDPANFLAVVNEAIARSPGGADQLRRVSQFTPQGIGAAVAAAPELLDQYRADTPRCLEELRRTFQFTDDVRDGWSYPPAGIGDFGENDRLRAAVALGGLAALGEEEAMYFHADRDASGAQLHGLRAYRWRLPPSGVPVDAFWSLTMYTRTPEGRFFFAENPINRYSVGDRTPGLSFAPDGSLEVCIQQRAPASEASANWLPAPPSDFRLALRAYLPRLQMRDRNWRVPPILAVD